MQHCKLLNCHRVSSRFPNTRNNKSNRLVLSSVFSCLEIVMKHSYSFLKWYMQNWKVYFCKTWWKILVSKRSWMLLNYNILCAWYASFCASDVQNHTCWDPGCTVGVPKQRRVRVDWYELLFFGSPTVHLASQHVWFCTMWLDRTKGPLFIIHMPDEYAWSVSACRLHIEISYHAMTS